VCAYAITGLRIRRPGTLVLPLARAKPALGHVLRGAARHPRVLRGRVGAARPARTHALWHRGRERDVERARAGVCRRARGRRFRCGGPPGARTQTPAHCHGARRAQRRWRLSVPACAGGLVRRRDVPRRVVALGGVAARCTTCEKASRRHRERMLRVSSFFFLMFQPFFFLFPFRAARVRARSLSFSAIVRDAG
jgi:hypothetical protein